MQIDPLSTTFAALADPTRRAILARLVTGEASVTELAEPFAMSMPAISKHLKVLENAGLVTRGRQAQWRPVRLEAEPLKNVADWVEEYARFWTESFDKLDVYLKEFKKPRRRNMIASTAKSSAPSATADREIVITRVFDAPRSMVFDAWTDPKHIAHWYGPNGFTTTVHHMDLRAGGDWRLTMRGPDGRDYNNRYVFSEVTKPAKLVYTHQIEPGTEPIGHQTTVTFEEKDGQTLVTLHMLFPTAERREFVVKTHGAIEGGKQTLLKLAEYLRMDGAGKESFADKTITITRVFDAPRAMVFQAWTDPKQLQQWFGPKVFTNPVCEADVRVGGKYHIVMRGPDGSEYPCGGVYQEIAPPERLVFTNDATDAEGKTILQGWTVVTFAEQEGNKTLLTLTTRGVARVPAAAMHLQGMEQGWSGSFEKLADLLA